MVRPAAVVLFRKRAILYPEVIVQVPDIRKILNTDPREDGENETFRYPGLGRKAASAAAFFILFLILSCLCYTPLPILERAEEQVRRTGSGEVPDLALAADPDEVSAQHRQLIRETQMMYSAVRDEIEEVIRSGPVTAAAVSRCQELAASGAYGPDARFGSFRWSIPESAGQLDLTLSPEEADRILYLYSQLYDMDFRNGSGTTFEGWFYGIEGTSALYPVEAFGNTYYYEGRGGYCMPLDKLKEIRSLAEKMAMKASREEARRDRLARAGNPLLVPFVFLMDLFVLPAEASEGREDASAQVYAAVMEAGYRTFGTAAAQVIIYTGIHDTLTGEITFTLSSEPADVWPEGTVYRNTLEEYARDTQAQAVVADYNSMPFKGKLSVVIRDEVSVTVTPSAETFRYIEGWREETVWREVPVSRWKRGDAYYDMPVLGGTEVSAGTKTMPETESVPIWSEELPCWTETAETHTKIIEIRAYDAEEWVSFTGTANINGSGLTQARQKLIEGSLDAVRSPDPIPEGMTAEDWIMSLFPEDLVYPDMRKDVIELANSTIGDIDGSHYMSNSYLGWCAGWVYTVYDRLGLTGQLADTMSGITKDVWTTYSILTHEPGDPVRRSDGSVIADGKGYEHSPNAKIAQFGYDGEDAYTAREGDVIFWRRDGAIAHIGIVTAVSEDSVTVTQGNSNDRVEMIRYTGADDGLGLAEGEIVRIPYDDYREMEVTG